ncbi:MAG: UDP-N-acetyl-D-glucosamine dehydrogenase [Chloroflexi bacterium]|nr:UDP-N-acetyl-D-glucosamine dehydrogenase [Chloroflexota bacterium]
MSHIDKLKEKINTDTAIVTVIGLGYVGLPLALECCKAGMNVFGFDVDTDKILKLNQGESYIDDISDEIVYKSISGHLNGTIKYTSEVDILSDTDIVIICVPTPLSKNGNPDVSFIESALRDVVDHVHEGMLIILESTIYPGATKELLLPKFQNNDGLALEVGDQIFIAFSPERVDPGRTDWTITNTPKVVGGITPQCCDIAHSLYARFVEHVITVSDTTTAEMVKLLENTFRATNIALVNEVAIMSELLNIDVWEVIAAAKTKPFGFMPFYPGPGIGGHCIPVDPRYLSWKMKNLNYDARFIRLAEDINSSMPDFVVNKIEKALNDSSKTIQASNILILGVTYKPNVSDIRESPALDVMQLLIDKCKSLKYSDPYVPTLNLEDNIYESEAITTKLLLDQDAVIILTDHSEYDLLEIITNSKLIIDTRNATRYFADTNTNISDYCDIVYI